MDRVKVISELKKEFGLLDSITDKFSSYILENGDILGTTSKNFPIDQHENIATFISKRYGVQDMDTEMGSKFMISVNAIRLNVWLQAITLPPKRISDSQMDVLIEFTLRLGNQITRSKPFMISVYNKPEQFKEYTGFKDVLLNLENDIDAYYSKGDLNADKFLTEATRNELVAKSQSGVKYQDVNKGNRWNRKDKCSINNTVADYNKIDMDSFWKTDVLRFSVKVKGETSSYEVGVSFNGVLGKIMQDVQRNKNKIDRDTVTKALIGALSSEDIKVSCQCPDFKYRFAYIASKQGYNEGPNETREASITNPTDNKGAACKHILAVLSNID